MTIVRQAIVLAAGEGRRLRPITLHTPKPLIPFYGRPLLDWAIDKLVAAGVSRIAVNAHHLADAIAVHVAALAAQHPKVAFTVSREDVLLGTGGAVRNLRGWLTPNEPFFVINADAVFAAIPADLIAARGLAAAALLVTREPTYAAERRLIVRDDLLVRLDEASDPAGFTFCGLTLADAGLPDRLPDGPSCILRQGFLPFVDHGPALTVACLETHAFFADTGTPEALIDAHIRGRDWVGGLPDPRLPA